MLILRLGEVLKPKYYTFLMETLYTHIYVYISNLNTIVFL